MRRLPASHVAGSGSTTLGLPYAHPKHIDSPSSWTLLSSDLTLDSRLFRVVRWELEAVFCLIARDFFFSLSIFGPQFVFFDLESSS